MSIISTTHIDISYQESHGWRVVVVGIGSKRAITMKTCADDILYRQDILLYGVTCIALLIGSLMFDAHGSHVDSQSYFS